MVIISIIAKMIVTRDAFPRERKRTESAGLNTFLATVVKRSKEKLMFLESRMLLPVRRQLGNFLKNGTQASNIVLRNQLLLII